jgi:AraC-like DNA-binding protein
VASDQSHEVDSPLALLATLWLEPDARQTRPSTSASTPTRIASLERQELARVVPRLRECWTAGDDSPRALALVDEVLGVLAPPATPPPKLDRRVAAARRLRPTTLRSRDSLAAIAAALSISPSRLTHLFSAELGISPRRYRLWLRLLDAVQELARGSSIAEAAFGAGFSDAPHLTRTFRRMLGFTPAAAHRVVFVPEATPRPRAVVGQSRFVQDAASRSG